MRVLVWAIELAIAVGVAWAAYRAFVGYLSRREAAQELESSRWKRRVIALDDGRVRVEVAKRGAEKAIPVQTLDPDAPVVEGDDAPLPPCALELLRRLATRQVPDERAVCRPRDPGGDGELDDPDEDPHGRDVGTTGSIPM